VSDTTRKLATIVALDVAGYSARTEADEARTIAQVTNLRPIIEGIAKAHGGRVFNTAGDGFMLEFGSAGSAVEAAIELAEECRPKVRVGVHIGDVTVQPNGDLLGHGVNVAARLMARSEPGKVTVSADVRRLIRGPLADQFVSRGPAQLDKMAETIEIFSLAASPAAAAQGAQPGRPAARTARTAWPTPRMAAMVGVPLVLVFVAALLMTWGGGDRTTSADGGGVPSASIAVLPFESLSGEKDAGYFAAGIQDEILTRLAKIGSLKVISRTSTAQFASKPENLREIARQLGVATILEGSVQKLGNAVHVNVQLIKAETDEHLWAETYDRKLDDIFGVEAEVATNFGYCVL
jgi:adenylate cyclase